MKKGYHDYIPVVKQEVKEEKKEEPKATHEPKYITTHGGMKYMISDERGMVVADTGILQFGVRMPSMHGTSRQIRSVLSMSTRDCVKYNGRY